MSETASPMTRGSSAAARWPAVLAVLALLGTGAVLTPGCLATEAQAAPSVAAGEGHGGGGAGGGHGEETGDGGGHAQVNWYRWSYDKAHGAPAFIFALLNFAVLAFLLGRYALPPLREFVRSRAANVRRELEEARRLHREAEARLSEYEERIGHLDAEIEALVAGIRTEAEAQKGRIVAAAVEHATRLRRETEFVISQEIKAMRIALERDTVEAAMAAAERLLRKQIDEHDQARLFESYLTLVAAQGTGGREPPQA